MAVKATFPPWVGRQPPVQHAPSSRELRQYFMQNLASTRLLLASDVANYAGPTVEVGASVFTVPGGILSAGMALVFNAYGTTAANANNKTALLYLGTIAGTAISTSGAVAANAKPWNIQTVVLCTGLTTSVVFTTGTFNGAIFVATRSAPAITWANDNVFTTSLIAGTTANDISQDFWTVELLMQPTPSVLN